MNLDDGVPPPGAALVEDLDKRLLVQLRDGRKLIGTLRHVLAVEKQMSANGLKGAFLRVYQMGRCIEGIKLSSVWLQVIRSVCKPGPRGGCRTNCGGQSVC